MVDISERGKRLDKYLQFVLNRASGSMRDDFYMSLAEYGLYLNKNEAAIPNEISGRLVREFHSLELTEDLTAYILETCMKRHRVRRLKTMPVRYCLTKGTWEEIERRIRQKSEIRRSARCALVAKVEQKYGRLSEDERRHVEATLYSFISLYLTSRTLASLRQLLDLTQTGNTLDITEFAPALSLAVPTAGFTQNLGFALEGALTEVISRPEFARFLYTALQTYVCFEVLQVDPDCTCLVEEFVKHGIVYFDTNFICDLLLPTRAGHAVAGAAWRQTRDLGFDLRITWRTEEEYKDHFETVDRTFRSQPAWEMKELARHDFAFIKDFWDTEGKDGASWDSYYLRLCKGFEDILSEYAIRIDRTTADFTQHSDFEVFCTAVSASTKGLGWEPKLRKIEEHDAFHLLMIKEMRAEEKLQEWGAKHWFVTQDKTLYPASFLLADRRTPPLSVLADTWLQTVSLFPFRNDDKLARTIPEILSDFLTCDALQAVVTPPPKKIKSVLAPVRAYQEWDYPRKLEWAREKLIKDKIVAPQDRALAGLSKLSSQFEADLLKSISEQRERRAQQERLRSLKRQRIERLALVTLSIALIDCVLFLSFRGRIEGSQTLTSAYFALIGVEAAVLLSWFSGGLGWFWDRLRGH